MPEQTQADTPGPRKQTQKGARRKPALSSPYDKPGFYEEALAQGRHRDIVGGRWEETAIAQMGILKAAGLRPDHVLLDIGAGSMRLGYMAVDYLEPGHYWATDASRALMMAGRELELADPARLPPEQLIEDRDFALPGIPDVITHAICFGVFTHITQDHLPRALASLGRLSKLERFLFSVFLAPDPESYAAPLRQRDGVVTHPDRAPRHVLEAEIRAQAADLGWALERREHRLPRGQVLFHATRA